MKNSISKNGIRKKIFPESSFFLHKMHISALKKKMLCISFIK
uniref:Uncharacterized protein n=1 Tax=Chlorella vulgaris TaxID=3077 RepID=V9H196_CHLVU|nr:hypothetical protein ChvulCp031 [Chlorella vulgaris]pir/T07219/ hypothetical protein 41a - Chlorella vulgaris chloroplast [Chlorella vulgaris]QSV10837.1 hypothetical protein [Chlorella vulgaris]BAA57866.1 unnamed protein product [Chlorella vulgaris]